ncbi:MAG: glycoside hydrolase family 26 protein [Alistipes sp.]|nr:glycoside hydrolase family 26 protein [Alistipes sp.]
MKKTILTMIASAAVAACTQNETPQPAQPCDTQATAATAEMFDMMKKAAAHGVMLGHQDDLSYGVGWVDTGERRSDVRDVCGDYPALFGWDLGHIELADSTRNLDGVEFERMRDNIRFVHEQGGVNALSWHPRNPLTGNDAWDISSTEVVSSIIGSGELHDTYTAWLDRVADFLLSLEDSDGEPIPVIFRPYHEMSGSWFWWGAKLCSTADYKQLWRETIDHLHSRGVHNIVVAYSMADYLDEQSFAERYPGDDYVDIVGFDIYQYGTVEEFLAQMKIKSEVAAAFARNHDKIWAVCECGYEGIPQDDWFTEVLSQYICGTDCSHALLWRNAHDREGHFYASYPSHSSADDMRRLASRDDVLMLGDYNSLKSALRK